jgi:thioredoxin-related protein
MRKALWISILLVSVISVASAADPVPGFYTDYEQAQKVAVRKAKPLYIHFTTDWCGWCRRIEKDIYETKEGKTLLADFVPVSLDCTQGAANAEANKKLMAKYGGKGYPFLVMTLPNGTLLKSFSGYKKMPAFKKELAAALAAKAEHKAFADNAAKADKTSVAYHEKAMAYHLKCGNTAEAAKSAAALKKLKKGDPAQLAFVTFLAAADAEDVAAATTAYGEVVKTDPKNEKGYYEKAAAKMVQLDTIALQELQKQVAARTLVRLKALVAGAKKLENPAACYEKLVGLQMATGDAAGALDSLKKLRPLMPIETQQQIDKMITHIENQIKNAPPAPKKK